MYHLSLLTLGLLAGCFNPDLTNVVYECTVEKLIAQRGSPAPMAYAVRPMSRGQLTFYAVP